MTVDPGMRRDSGYRAPAPAPTGRGPSRRTVILSLLGSAAAASVTGSLYGLLRPGPGVVTATSLSPSPTPSAAPTSSAAVSAKASPSTSPSPSVRATPSPLAANPITEPWKDKRNDFVTVSGLRKDGTFVALRVDRLTFLTGDAAAKYYDANPDKERLDYAIVNQNPKIFTYTLVPGAPIYGSQLLTGQVDLKLMSQDEFVGKVNELLGNKTPVYLWLRHEDGGKGWTTYVAEQFLP